MNFQEKLYSKSNRDLQYWKVFDKQNSFKVCIIGAIIVGAARHLEFLENDRVIITRKWIETNGPVRRPTRILNYNPFFFWRQHPQLLKTLEQVGDKPKKNITPHQYVPKILVSQDN